MSKEFYDYIAKNTLSFFQAHAAVMRFGERYCLKLDTEKMVKGVDYALKELTRLNNIQGKYEYGDVYSTFTIKLRDDLEIVVASKINGMTDDFLATLRNAELTSKHFPILMITHSAIDTITSGTGNLAANGMPFHSISIISKIKEDIQGAQLSVADKTLLEYELDCKQSDRFSDKSSLFEYSELLTILGRGFVKKSDYSQLSLLMDPEVEYMVDEKKIRERLNENHRLFRKIDQVMKHGTIPDDLEKEFDNTFISYLMNCKKKNIPWYEECTYTELKASQDKMKKKLDNPLVIDDSKIEVYSNSILEYPFVLNEQFFIRDDGDTKAKKRKKNIIVYNPDHKENITIDIGTNITIRQFGLEKNGCEVTSLPKLVRMEIKAEGCSFAQVKITDTNNKITYEIKVCVINVAPKYLENIQTLYLVNVASNLKRSRIQIYGVTANLIINPGFDEIVNISVESEETYECRYNQTVNLMLNEETIDADTGRINCKLKFGTIVVPIQFRDEVMKQTEITGAGAFKWKFTERKSLEYRNGKIIAGTKEFSLPKFSSQKSFRYVLSVEDEIVRNEWLAISETPEGLEEYPLEVENEICSAYISLLKTYKKYRTLPSLAYYSKDLLNAASSYINVMEQQFAAIESGTTLGKKQNDALLLGCVIKDYDEKIIAMSPVHPLNIMYQIELLKEEDVGAVREKLIEKLTALYLIPFIKDSDKNLYQAIEQKYAPEWRYYAPVSNKRYQGTRNFIQKLVCDKIIQYKEHFAFLFDDIGNKQFFINLINMGDCREIFQGLLLFYAQKLKKGIDPDDLLSFTINIYADRGMYNEFTLLSDQRKLKEYIRELYCDEEVSDLELIMTGKIRCYFRNPEETEYRYAHLTFYEMASSEDAGASRMDFITTGTSLHGLNSGMPSVLNSGWYKTGFGTKYAEKNQLIRLATYYNALYRVAFSGSSYEPSSCIFTEIEQGQEGLLGKIYSSSNWVIFVNPKVDLSFFQKKNKNEDELLIIHYSDQSTSASGYDDITVTQKSTQYNEIIYDQLKKKGVIADAENINEIINLFNAINGGWMLRLITAKKPTGFADSYFSREKMSILSAIKVCMAYYAHPDIVWIPISLEEMLRVSGGAGLSQKDGILSAKNLGFEQRPTSDDVLLVGIEGPKDEIKIYIHPVEVKIGQNPQTRLNKANIQVLNTYNGLWNALWPDEHRNTLERKLSRNFFIQLILVCCEKMKLYNIYPDEKWDDILDVYRQNLLNEKYEFSNAMDQYIGKGTIVSFGTDTLSMTGKIYNDVCLLEFPEKMGSSYMVLSAKAIEQSLEEEANALPVRIRNIYSTQAFNEAAASMEEGIEGIFNVIQKEQQNVARTTSVNLVAESSAEYIAESREKKKNMQISDMMVRSDNTVEEQVGMQIVFGRNMISGQPVIWEPNDTNQLFHTNMGIIGTMGTGKTQFTKSLITQLYCEQNKNIGNDPLGILIFDYKGDYNESKMDFVTTTKAKILKPYHLPLNPLALTKSKVFKPLLPIHTANTFKDTIAKVYNLGPKQQNTLFQCIIDAYALKGIIPGNPSTWENVPPTFDTIYSLYADNEDIKKNDSLAAAMDKLYQFQIFEKNSAATESLFDLLKGVIVIDLSGYDADIQNLIVAITLDLFYSQMQGAGSSELNGQFRQLTKLILVDEADNFMKEGFPALKKILKEGREFGVGTILSTQFLKHFGNGDEDYAKYILTWVVHNVADLKNTDVEFVFKTEAKSTEAQIIYHDIKALPKHHSIVKISSQKPQYIQDKAFWQLYNELKSTGTGE